MKRSEKLFLAINEIDEKIIDEARDKEERPVRVQLEKRMPIKEIIAFAACFAVIAVAIFALVKFKLGGEIEPQPIDSNSSDSSDQSYVSDPEKLTFTEQDRKLQTILKELVTNAEEIDGMFNDLSISGEKYKFKLGEYSEIEYYLVPDNTRTANGLFAVPQSYDEMKQLLSRYFSPQAAVFYMENVSSGSAAESPSDGIFHIDFPGYRVPMFIEINGRMYVDPSSRGYQGMGIDCETAKVIRQTDKIIEFSYWGYDYNSYGGDVYSERNGIIVNDDSAWKLHYFYDFGFISEFPAEYTEQDLELQNILKSLEPGDDVRKLFSVNSLGGSGEIYKFRLPDNDPPDSTTTYIDVSGLQPKINHPKSINELRQRMLEYFTAEATDKYMWNVCNGTMTANSDGTYTVTLDKDLNYPTYIEIDGKMFYWGESVGTGGGSWYYNTAKVTEQTDDIIIFSYTVSGIADFERTDERLVYERGGWKRDPFYQPADPEADNNELQAILSTILPSARELDNIFAGVDSDGDEYVFVYDGIYDHKVAYYPVADNLRTKPNGQFSIPKSRAEAEDLLSEYFSKRAVKSFINAISNGIMFKDPDGTYTVTTDRGYLTTFIYINDQLFCSRYYDIDLLNFDPTAASIISKTDKTIKFQYTTNESSEKCEGALVYENGGWKLNYFYWDGFISEYPTEFTAEDEELQEILQALSPGETIRHLFNAAGDTSRAYHFVIDGLETADDLPTFYVKLPTGKFADGKEEYPQSYNELEAFMLKYYTQQTADWYMQRANNGTITSSSDNNYYIKTEKPIGNNIPFIIEVDGEMYYRVGEKSGSGSALWDTATVTSRTDDTIVFSHLYYYYAEYTLESGTIKYERGGWRFELR